MIPPQLRVLFALGPLLGVGWLCLALIDPDGTGRLYEYIGLGYLLGTMFGQTGVAAAWAAFGPLPWYVRLPLAAGWLVVLVAGVGVNMAQHGGPDEILWLFMLLLIGQWLLMQVPFWALSLTYGLELRHHSAVDPADRSRARPALQFGIRQLMTLTLVVAIVLGILRAVIVLVVKHLGQQRGGGDAVIFVFLAVAACVMCLPLAMAALLPRRALPATIAVLVLGALATAWELPLLRLLPKAAGPDQWHFVFINGFTAVWIVALIGAVRLNGYRLVGQGLPVTG